MSEKPETESVEITLKVHCSKLKDGQEANDARLVSNPVGSDALFLARGNVLMQVVLSDIVEKVEKHVEETA